MTDLFLKAVAGVLIAIVIGLLLARQAKDLAILLAITVCCLVIGAALVYLRPVIDFVYDIQNIGKLDSQIIKILLKAVGISLIAELAALICTDSGNASIGKALQIAASFAILWISLPLLNELIDLIESVLGAV